MKKILKVLIIIIIAVAVLGGAGFFVYVKFINKDFLKPVYAAETNITYSSGSDNNWSYGNQRKEFSDGEECYVRIGSTVSINRSAGVGTNIEVTYRFTGTEKCPVELSDGIAKKKDTDDPNVTEFTRSISAEKGGKAKEEVIIFQYSPDGAKSVVCEVIYDDSVPEKYDSRNTVYFKESK